MTEYHRGYNKNPIRAGKAVFLQREKHQINLKCNMNRRIYKFLFNLNVSKRLSENLGKFLVTTKIKNNLTSKYDSVCLSGQDF